MSGPVAQVGQSSAPVVGDPLRSGGWDDFRRMMEPAKFANPLRPGDDVLMELARYAETEQGRKVLAWLHSVTDQTPYPQVGGSFENVALAAAKHQGRALIGAMLTEAVKEGQALRNSQKG